MGWFWKKKWNTQKSDENKGRLRELFNAVVENGDSYNLVYGYSLDVKNTEYIIAKKTTYTYTSLIIGYRESDMSLVLVKTSPELDGCGEAEIFNRDNVDKITKIKFPRPIYTLFQGGGLKPKYTQFYVQAENDDEYIAYMYQAEECKKFDEFIGRF